MGSSSEMGNAPPPISTQYGITKPISTAGPTEADLKRTAELERVCLLYVLFLYHTSVLISLIGHPILHLIVYRYLAYAYWCLLLILKALG